MSRHYATVGKLESGVVIPNCRLIQVCRKSREWYVDNRETGKYCNTVCCFLFVPTGGAPILVFHLANLHQT